MPNLFSYVSSLTCQKPLKNDNMKNLIGLLFLLFLVSNVAQGQSNWQLGGTIIMGLSGEKDYETSSYGDPSFGGSNSMEESKLLPSCGGGFTLQRSIANRWSVNLGMHYQYIQRFDRDEYQYINSLGTMASYSKNDQKLITHQVQAPLSIHFYFGKKGKLRPFLNAGGQASYAIHAKQTSESLYVSNGERNYSLWEQEYDLRNEWSAVKRISISTVFGAGVAFNRFSIEINRVQKVLSQNNYNDYIYYPTVDDIYTSRYEEKTSITALSLKYWL